MYTKDKCDSDDERCVHRWDAGEWSSCSATCGVGLMTRTVACTHRPSRDSNRTEVLRDEDCQNPKPSPVQACNRFDCPPTWDTPEWGQVTDLSLEVQHRKYLAKQLRLTTEAKYRCIFVAAVLPELWWWISKEAGLVQTAVGGWQHPGAAWHLLLFQESFKPAALCQERVPTSVGHNGLVTGTVSSPQGFDWPF